MSGEPNPQGSHCGVLIAPSLSLLKSTNRVNLLRGSALRRSQSKQALTFDLWASSPSVLGRGADAVSVVTPLPGPQVSGRLWVDFCIHMH